MVTKSVSDVGRAVLYAAMQSAIDPLFDCILQEFCNVYGLSDQDRAELFDHTYDLSSKLDFARDVAYEDELRRKKDES